MVGTLQALIGFALFATAAFGSYFLARRFVQRRLRFVDAVRSPFAPLIAGGVAFLVAWPLAALLPVVSTVTAIVFGVGTALGTSAGVRALTRAEVTRGRLYSR
jgi:hypothetical protein